MKKLKGRNLFFLSIIIMVLGCEDIFEEDISAASLELVSPEDGAVIESNYVDFWWLELEGSDQYRVQVMNDHGMLLKDTVSSNNTLELDFDPGHYSWRIRAKNFAYETGYTEEREFDVVSNNDLSFQKVFLLNPSDSIYIKKRDLVLQWRTLNFADNYGLQITKTLQGNRTVVLDSTGIEATSYSLNENLIEEDAIYSWRVKGLNDISETEYSQRKIFLDNEPPGKPLLETPNDNYSSTVSLTISFDWSIPADQGEVVSRNNSRLEIARDINFDEVIEIIEPEEAETEATYIFEEAGIYYWRVNLVDLAGNIGEYSSTRKITIQ